MLNKYYKFAVVTVFVTAAIVLSVGSVATAHQPHDPVNIIKLSPAFSSDWTLFAVLDQKDILFKSIDGGRTFYPPTDPLASKKILSLAFSTNYSSDGIVFAGTEGYGIYKSSDRGETWTSSSVGITDMNVTSIAISPEFSVDMTLYAGTGNGGLFRSRDGGSNWEGLSMGVSAGQVSDIAISPSFASDRIVFVSIRGQGVFASYDGGDSWTPANSGLSNPAVTSLALPAGPFRGTVLVSTWGGGVFMSVDAGLHWQSVNNGLSDLYVNDVEVAPNGDAFLATRDGGVFRALNGSGTWELTSFGLDDLSDQTDNHFRDIAISSDYAVDKTIFVGMFEGLYYSNTRGNLWLAENLAPQTMNRGITISPAFGSDGTVYAGTYGGGVLKSTDKGISWEAKNITLNNTYIDPIRTSSAYAADMTVLMGTDTGIFKSVDGGDNWSYHRLKPTDVLYVRQLELSPDFTHDQTAFTAAEFLEGVFRSTDGGETWTQINNGLPAATGVRGLTLSPSFAVDRTVFVTVKRKGVYKSTNGGDLWQPSNSGIETLTAEAIVLSPDYASDGTIFIGTVDQGIFRSTDWGQTWFMSNTGLDFLAIQTIAVSPDFSSDAIVLAGTSVGGIYKSIDGGVTWNKSSAGILPNMVRDIEFSPDYAVDGTVFAGTYKGLYKSTDGGASWLKVQYLNRYEDHSDLVFFKGGWKTYKDSWLSGNSLTYAKKPGEEAHFEFAGTRVVWIATRGPNHGIANVYIDGNLVDVVDLYSAGFEYSVPAIDIGGLLPGVHDIIVEATGASNAASRSSYISVDAFEVIE